jgi:hypothetical protein
MKLTHLNTLLKRIDEIESLFINNKINSTKWRHLVMEHIDFLNEIVHIGLFVAAKDGKPLEKPKGKSPKRSIWEPYNEAQKEVIFEGWEVLEQDHKKAIQIHNKATGFSLEQLSNGEFWLWSSGSSLSKRIETLSNLAEATQSNPLKLK